MSTVKLVGGPDDGTEKDVGVGIRWIEVPCVNGIRVDKIAVYEVAGQTARFVRYREVWRGLNS